MFKSNIENNEVTKLPRIVFEGNSIVVSSAEELNKQLATFTNESIVGFDTESKPSFKKGISNGIALLQLATSNKSLLIRIKETGITNSLVKLLEDPNTIKVGAAIRDDLKGLFKIRKFTPKAFIDLQNVAQKFDIESVSVRKLAAIVLQGRVSKRQQLSNWEANPFTDQQIEYAATDAWVCKKILEVFCNIDPNIIKTNK